MKSDPSKFKVIDLSDGKNIATDFNSREDAQKFIDWYAEHPESKPPGSMTDPSLSHTQTEALPPGFGQTAPPPTTNNPPPPTTNNPPPTSNTGGVNFPPGFPFHNVPDPRTGQTGGGGAGGNGGGAGGTNTGGVRTGTSSIRGRNVNIDNNINGVRKYYKLDSATGNIETNMTDAEILAIDPTLPLPQGGTTTPPPTTPTTPGTSTGNFNPGFSTGIGNAPINGGFPGISNLYRPQGGAIGVGGGGAVIGNPSPTTPTTPTTPKPGLGGWLDNLFGGIFGNIFGNLGGTGNGSINKSWTDANGNNFNFQSDINTTNQVNTGTGGNITQSQSNGGGASGNEGGGNGMNVNPNGVISMGGMVVDGKTGRITMSNGMIVDGSTGTVTMPGNGAGGSGNGNGVVGGGGAIIGTGATDAFGIPWSAYPDRARSGSAAEGERGPWRSGQDLTKPFFDWMAPAPYVGAATSGVLGSNLNPATGGIGGGGGGLPDIQHWMDWINNMISNVFRGIAVNLTSNAFVDSDKVYSSTQKIVGMKLGTLIK